MSELIFNVNHRKHSIFILSQQVGQDPHLRIGGGRECVDIAEIIPEGLKHDFVVASQLSTNRPTGSFTKTQSFSMSLSRLEGRKINYVETNAWGKNGQTVIRIPFGVYRPDICDGLL